MQIAIVDSQRVTASPLSHGTCPACGGEVNAKCGEIVTWHWAHLAQDCDQWAEPESAWHSDWKTYFPEECREVVIGHHRADVVAPNGFVVELQRSSISTAEIAEREAFYGRQMVWIVDGSQFAENFIVRNRGSHLTFRWKWPRKSWFQANRRVFIDFPEGLFSVKKLYGEVPCGGWGTIIDRTEFMGWLLRPGMRRYASVDVEEVA